MTEIHDIDLLTVARWAVTFQEVRIKQRGNIWGEEDAMVSGGARADPSGECAAAGAITVMGEAGSNQVVLVVRDKSNGVEAAEELLAAAEWASNERRVDDSHEVVVGGRVVATPVLRTTVVEPRGGDSGNGASQQIPFEAGDFSDSAEPRDVIDAFRLEPGVEAVMRGARSLEDRTSALLSGALLSAVGASDTGGLGAKSETAEEEAEEPEPKPAAEQRVTTVEEVKEYLK
ncbi:hypothetical protein RHMOL_Rhmol02G0192500 [Rhododendron molle]|uniref:Uncharacterized protein n=1 Tax=Rhododendron molle TaxID=49168 RepID=A0ACC0PUA0_RHOML|nr:hypothetical protein RHMOL_Rhmol02G0192500 [Rhododendron molle]